MRVLTGATPSAVFSLPFRPNLKTSSSFTRSRPLIAYVCVCLNGVHATKVTQDENRTALLIY